MVIARPGVHDINPRPASTQTLPEVQYRQLTIGRVEGAGREVAVR